MTSNNEALKEFNAPLSTTEARAYPSSITVTQKSRHALQAYNDRLLRDEKANFVQRENLWSILLWDLYDGDKEFRFQSRLVAQQPESHNGQEIDPRCRFFFIQTAGSRGALCCSLEQLACLLTHHQVMPAFLDFCFEFKRRGDPVMTNWLRLDDCVLRQSLPEAAAVPRALRIQHCFNIMAFEAADEGSDYSWPLRHTTAYHSFDFEQGRALWIVIKGNRLMRDRITHSPKPEMPQPYTAQDSFRASLKTHVQILEWCTETWGSYVEHFEKRARKHSTVAKHAPVGDLAKAAQTYEATSASRRAAASNHVPGGLSRAGTGLSRAFTGISNFARRTTGISLPSQKNDDGLEAAGAGDATISKAGQGGEKEKKTTDAKFDEIFTFEDQQDIHRLTGELETACLVIDQNLKILGGLRQRYVTLAETKAECGPFASDISDFAQQIVILVGDLETYRARIKMLSQRLEKDEEMFKRALEYRNMVTGVRYALAAQISADKMHKIAQKTEDKTVSMHVITILGLLFLPGTFVSTLLSSGILDFEGRPDGSAIGDWNVRWAALKIFLLLCLLLMAFTVPIWWAAYKLRRRE